MKNKKVLLVGGCGFIGHNLSLYLEKLGHEVYLLDSFGVNNLITLIDNKDNINYNSNIVSTIIAELYK